ncbi:response regulator [Jatrophihabitans sp. DSM 45814]
MIRLLLVDDHALVRAGLAGLLLTALDIEVVGEASDGKQALTLDRELAPDLVLMDVSMPVMDGVTATRELINSRPGARVLALTSFSDESRVNDMLDAGAIGYLLKDCEPSELMNAIRAAAKGHSPIDPRVAASLLPGRRTERTSDGLSAREREVLGLASKGLANKQIARALGISERTVKAHLGSVFRQIGVGDRTSAAIWARENLKEPDLT